MPEDARPVDKTSVILELLRQLDPSILGRIAVIGGQALSLWAFHYLINELSPEEEANVTSDDLDFLGTKDDVIQCATAWGTEYSVPSLMDSTPNTGLIYVPYGEERLGIDFLDHVYGVDNGAVEKGIDRLIIEGVIIRVLTPVLCLQSRLNNLYHLGYGKAKADREVIRIRVLLRVVRKYLIDLLNAGEQRKALNWSNDIMRLANSNLGLRIAFEHGINLTEAIPERHAGYGPNFRNGHYAHMMETISKRLGRYAAQKKAIEK